MKKIKNKLNSPFYVQALGDPKERSSFGGNGEQGAFSDESFKKLTKIFSFIGMGAAEFEGRKSPDALSKISLFLKRNELTVKKAKMGFSKKQHEVYVVCQEDCFDEILRVCNKFLDPKNTKSYTKGHDLFKKAINDQNPTSFNRLGWLFLENYDYPYLIFLSKETASQFIQYLYKNPDMKYLPEDYKKSF